MLQVPHNNVSNIIPRQAGGPPHHLIPFQNNQLDIRKNDTSSEVVLLPNVTSLDLPVKNDNVLSQQRPLVQLQPHQGRNPCAERNNRANLAACQDQEVPLVHSSLKHRRPDPPRTSPEEDVVAEAEDGEAAEVPDVLIRSIAQPISYLKNDFSSRDQESSKRLRFLRHGQGRSAKPPVYKQPKASNVNHEREREQLLHASADERPSCNSAASEGNV